MKTKKNIFSQLKKQFFENFDFQFIFITSLISFLLASLYLYKAVKTEFTVWTWIIVSLNFLYIPFILIFKRKSFPVFYLIYSLIVIFVEAFTQTYLHNNFTCLFILFIVIMIQPKLKHYALVLYVITITIASIFNDEDIYLYIIHMLRVIWFAYVFFSVIEKRYKRKQLILYDDEIKILTLLCKNRLQKSIEFEGYSESTIYRRLKAAMTRNKLTKQDLIEEFKKEYSHLLK